LAFFASALATSSLGTSFLCLFFAGAGAVAAAVEVVLVVVVAGGGAVVVVLAGCSSTGRPLKGDVIKPMTLLKPEAIKSSELRRLSVMVMRLVMVMVLRME